jgi:hypothetical protein
MKKKLFLMGILNLALVFGVALLATGCGDSDSGGDGAKKYTVTFDLNGGTRVSGQLVQEIEEKKLATAPTVTPPTGKEANGWTSSVTAIPDPDSPITANVTFTAKWKDKASDDPVAKDPDAKDPDAKDPDDTGNNPLAGTMWYMNWNGTNNNDDEDDPDELIIFGKQYFYGLGNADDVDGVTHETTNIDTSNHIVYIDGNAYVYELKGSTLTVTDYINGRGETADVPFTRIEGSTNTDVYDVWYTAGRVPTDPNRTILVIKTDKTTFTVKGTSWVRREYIIDVSNKRIDWRDDNATQTYSGGNGNSLTLVKTTTTYYGQYTKTTL